MIKWLYAMAATAFFCVGFVSYLKGGHDCLSYWALGGICSIISRLEH